MYYKLQQEIYRNKVMRKFNTANLEHEITLMAEELGELCDAHLLHKKEELIDAIGDIMVYALGLSAIFNVNSDEIMNRNVEGADSLESHILYISREIGRIAKNYKKSNKKLIPDIDRKDEFVTSIGSLLGYCENALQFLDVNPVSVVETIVLNNKSRSHEGNF